MALASTALNIYTQTQQDDAAQDQADALKDQALEAKNLDMEALGAKELEIEDQASLDIKEREKQQVRDAAEIRVAQSESGAFGNSALMQLSNSMMQSGLDTSIIRKNAGNAKDQVGRDRKRVEAQYKARISNAEAMEPNSMMSGLKIASTALSGASSAYSSYQGLNVASPTTNGGVSFDASADHKKWN